MIGAGAFHTCALTKSGSVVCWGGNRLGQLGEGTTCQRLGPVPIPELGTGVVALTIGDSHTCALKAAGKVVCWGDNAHGQLGQGIQAMTGPPAEVAGVIATEVAAGSFHTCALAVAGKVTCWGENTLGQLGDGTTRTQRKPQPVKGISDKVVAIGAGHSHTCALTAGGEVQCWGSNSDGQLMRASARTKGIDYSTRPLPIPELTTIQVIAASDDRTCTLNRNGSAVCWGGIEKDDCEGCVRPSAALLGISAYRHVCADVDGTVRCLPTNPLVMGH